MLLGGAGGVVRGGVDRGVCGIPVVGISDSAGCTMCVVVGLGSP